MTTFSVTHANYSPNLSFEDFTANFEGQCGINDVKAYQTLLTDPEQKSTAEKVIGGQAGPSGFMIFAVHDHGSLLNIKGAPRKAKQYVVGNPLIAARMTQHDIRAALYAPLRVLVYEDADSRLQVEYDLPSTLFGQFHNPQVDAVAKELDEKLGSLVRASAKLTRATAAGQIHSALSTCIAMRDGAEVAAALIEGEWDWVEVVREFEAKMFPRAEVATVGARDGVEATFSEGGLAHLLKHVQETGV